MTPLKRLYFDIETAPCIGYFWRPGYKINLSYQNIIVESAIICICWKWNYEEEVKSLTWNKSHSDKAMLKKFIKVANKADEIVGHNGDRFDLKWIKTRCLYHRIPTFPSYTTIDTLKHARSTFNFNSNRLDYVAQYLGVGEKTDTGGFELWEGCMNNNPESLDKMVEYCKNDVVILEKVWDELNNYVKHKSHSRVHSDLPKWTCPECASKNVWCNKTSTTSMGTIKRTMMCKDCKKYYNVSNKTYMDFIIWRSTGKETTTR